MNINSIMRALIENEVRRIDGEFEYENKRFQYKAYKISNPQNIIRIDIREIRKNGETT